MATADGGFIESQLTAMEEADDPYRALAHVMTVVEAINQEPPTSGLVKKLKKWIERLVKGLTEIVDKLPAGTSFSISAGKSVSVTVNFPPTRASAQERSWTRAAWR